MQSFNEWLKTKPSLDENAITEGFTDTIGNIIKYFGFLNSYSRKQFEELIKAAQKGDEEAFEKIKNSREIKRLPTNDQLKILLMIDRARTAPAIRAASEKRRAEMDARHAERERVNQSMRDKEAAKHAEEMEKIRKNPYRNDYGTNSSDPWMRRPTVNNNL